MAKYYTPEFVGRVLALHDFHCIFELDAPRKIAERLQHRTMDEWLEIGLWLGKENSKRTPAEISARRAEFHQCFSQSEIYCPHEGIDRRAELGVSTDWV